MYSRHKLGKEIMKTADEMTLWESEKGLLKVDKNALAVQILKDEEHLGYVFGGKSKFILDTIVETEKGAIGKPVEKEVSQSFVMIARKDEVRDSLVHADDKDLAAFEDEHEKTFLTDAEDLLNRFLDGPSRRNRHSNIGSYRGVIFAFQNEKHEFDILIAKGSKLVYKAAERVFISNGGRGREILKSEDGVVISQFGNSIVVMNNSHPHVDICRQGISQC
jgi:hypothetical protein